MPDEYEIPALTNFPEYRVLVEKRGELQADLQSVRGQINELLFALANNAGPESKLRQAAAVAEALGDNVDAQVIPDRSRLAPLQQRERLLQAVLEELGRRITAARIRASVAICAAVMPVHDGLVADVCVALAEAQRAALAYVRFADALNAGDIAWSGHLRPMHPTAILGNPRDPQSRLALYFRDAAAYRLFPPEAIPSELQWPPPALPLLPPKARVAELKRGLARRAAALVRQAPAEPQAGKRVA